MLHNIILDVVIAMVWGQKKSSKSYRMVSLLSGSGYADARGVLIQLGIWQ